MRFLIILPILLLSLSCFASVKVTRFKGTVHFWTPGSTDKKILAKYEQFPLGTTIETQPSSFVKLQFNNMATATIGPNSRVLVSHPPEANQAPLIRILKGRVRAFVDKKSNPENKVKMLLYSRSAAVGVRGTELLMSYNDQNQVTSTITFKGEVAKIKHSDQTIKKDLLTSGKRDTQLGVDQSEEALKKMDHQHSVGVRPGEFAASYPSNVRPTKAVKLSPAQFRALRKNIDLEDERSDKLLRHSPPDVIQETQSHDSEDGLRPGGHLHVGTGIYFNPPENSKFDPKTQTYVMDKKYGAVDYKTGEFVPPKEAKVHPFHGLVAINSPDDKPLKLGQFAGLVHNTISESLQTFKKVSNLEIEADGAFGYTSNVIHKFLREYRQVSAADAYMWKMQGFARHHTVANHRWELLPYISGTLNYHNRRSDAGVKKNDHAALEGGVDVKYKWQLRGRRAITEAKLYGESDYRDFRNQNQFDFFSRVLGFKILQGIKPSKNNELKMGYGLGFFRTFDDSEHGRIHSFHTEYSFRWNQFISLLFDLEFARQIDDLSENNLDISTFRLGIRMEDLPWHSELVFKLAYEFYDPTNDPTYTSAHLYSANSRLSKGLGSYWKLFVNHSYTRQNATDSDSIDFIQHEITSGVSFIF